MAAQRTHVCARRTRLADRALACAAVCVAVAAAGCAPRTALLGVRGRRFRVRRQRRLQCCIRCGQRCCGCVFCVSRGLMSLRGGVRVSRSRCVRADAVFVALSALRCVHRLAQRGREGRWRQRRGGSSTQESRADVVAPRLHKRSGQRRRMRHARCCRRGRLRSGDGGTALALSATSSYRMRKALQRWRRRAVGRRGPRVQRTAPLRHSHHVRRARSGGDERAAAAAGGAKQRSESKQRQQPHRGRDAARAARATAAAAPVGRRGLGRARSLCHS